ncbi:MAG TPA: hypothetical protein VG870_09775 [Chitinophagaceae bacterium]|nr:hypothetical protein [Chitinophagaceae bacterium]
MKYLLSGLFSLALFVGPLSGWAQKMPPPVGQQDPFRPRLFQDLPDNLPLRTGVLQPLLRLQAGQTVQIPLSDRFTFEGIVSSSVSKYHGVLRTVVIRCTNRPGAGFTLSERTAPDGSVVFAGRIVSFQAGDCYELKQEQGTYVLVKRNFYDMVND